MWNQLKTLILIGALSALVIGVGAALAPGQLPLFVGLSLVMNLGAWFFSDRLVLRMHRARPLERAEAPRLHTIVDDLAARAGIPAPRLYLIPEAQPNAFATGRNPERGVVAVTEGIVQLLSERELRGVLAHEIAHIKNRDILVASIAAAMTSMLTWAAHALSFAGLFGSRSNDEAEPRNSGAGSLLMVVVAPIAATLVQLGISRSREYLADETGAKLSGDPEALARALIKLEQGAAEVPAGHDQPATASLFIVNPFAGVGGLTRLFSTHPETAERVRRLRALASPSSTPAAPSWRGTPLTWS